jgi:thiamine-monophosphate kinase
VPKNHDRLTERDAIQLLERAFRGQRSSEVEKAIGDDAAVLRGGLVWTIDACVEGVHFDRKWLSIEQIGNRAIEAALSDLGAMGAEPIGALVALTLPKRCTRREIEALAKGQARAAKRTRCPIIGGNITAGPVLSLTTTAFGRASRPLRRDGAHAGDELWLVGKVGWARAGLELLKKRKKKPAALIKAWREPRALIDEGKALVDRATACVDVSDGLAGDAWHLADESDLCIVIESERLAHDNGPVSLEQALAGGEDYALLATGPARRRPSCARRIGRVERGGGVLLEIAGKCRALSRAGFDHLG